MAPAPTRGGRGWVLVRAAHSARSAAPPNTAAQSGQAHDGGVNTAAGTAIAAIPKPTSASPPPPPRSSSTLLRIRSRQYAPVAAQSAASSQPGEAGPCTPTSPLDVGQEMPRPCGAQSSARVYAGSVRRSTAGQRDCPPIIYR